MTTRRPGFFAAASLASHQIGQVNPGAHRYWRLNIPTTQATGSGPDDNFSVAEVAMRAFIGGTNVASGQTYAASSAVDAANDADKAFDSNSGTQLATTDATNAWVSVDFGAGTPTEVHEIVYTSRTAHARQQPAEIRIEYSDDNVIWFVAWVEEPATWLDTQETRTFQAAYAEAQYATTDFVTLSPNLTCEASWGTLLRNHGYTGPALRVEDNANPGTFTDIFFDSDGLIRIPRPFGDDTRVVTLYDQVGNSDLFAVLADDISIQEHGEYSTWVLDFAGSGELTSTNVTNGLQSWEITNPVWACGFQRTDANAVRLIWGVPANTNFMKMGLWHENADLHWRVNSGNAIDWVGTDWIEDIAETQVGGIERAIGDMSNGSPAKAWYRGQNAGTRTYVDPITYDPGHPVNMGGGILSDFTGQISELSIFDPAVILSDTDKDALDEAMKEANFFVTEQEVISTEQRVHVLLGTNPQHASSRAQRSHAVFGTATTTVSSTHHEVFTIMGGHPTHIRTRQARVHVIIVP